MSNATLFETRETIGGALISECDRYRYWLTREWNSTRPRVAYVGLNPSTADATADDPTMRRLRRFAERDGFGSFVMLNLFAIRATDPKVAAAAEDPVGPDTDRWIRRCIKRAEIVVACWGTQPWIGDRDADVIDLIWREKPMKCFGLTKGGSPRHPLYLRSDTPLSGFPVC